MQHPSIQDEYPGVIASCPPGVGVLLAFKTAGNVGLPVVSGVYAQGCLLLDTTNGDWYVNLSAIGSNATWQKRAGVFGGPAPATTPSGADPSSILTQFGSGTATFPEEGNVNRQVSSAGINPGATGADNVLAFYSLPANSFDGLTNTNRGLNITAAGQFANNVNSKRVKIYWGCTTATVGSTVTGGTVIADTGAFTTAANVGWSVSANVFKYGAANSNTQLGIHTQAQMGSSVGTLLIPTLLTATENAAILIAVTGNAATAATDISFQWMEINAMN